MVYDLQQVHIIPGLMRGNGLPKYMRQRRDGTRPRETAGEREQIAACFAFMNGATHLGGLDGNYDGAFIGSLNTSAAAGGVSNAMMLNAIKNDVVLTESDYRILKINRDTLLYLLQKVYDYETQYLLQRSITVYGLRSIRSSMKMKREAGTKMLRHM